MTEQEKILKAHSILSAVRNTVALQLEEVDKLLASTSPAQGKKRRNLRIERIIDFDRQYNKPKTSK